MILTLGSSSLDEIWPLLSYGVVGTCYGSLKSF